MSDTKIAPTTLGRNRARYENMRQLDGITEEQVNQAIELDAKLLNVTLDDYIAELAKLNKPSGGGKREQDKVTRDSLITETQDLLSVINLAVSVNRGDTTIAPKQKQRIFDKLGEYGNTLTNHLKTAFSPVGGMTMFWNPSSQVSEAIDGLAVYIGGWEDGSKNLRYQYAPRKCPISKRSGYRDDSFDVPIFEINVKANKEPEPPQDTVNEPEPDTEPDQS